MRWERPVPDGSLAAIAFGRTRAALENYRRRAWRLLTIGLGLLGAVLIAGVTGATAGGEWRGTLATWAGGGGGAAVVVGAGSLRIARRMRNTLSYGPWIACPAIALPVGSGAPRLVLRTPGGSDFLALTAVVIRQRYGLVVPESSGVLWWCGDPGRGGVVSRPGGEILVWTRPTRRPRRRERDAQRALSRGLLERATPRQPQLSEPSELSGSWESSELSEWREGGATATTTLTTPHPDPHPRLHPPSRPRRRRPLFLWIALVAVALMGLGIAGSRAAERDPQVDLTVLHEDARGNCTVTWRDPWSGEKHKGPYRCDTARDPILGDWDTGFVVSYGPWKGDLYNSHLDGTPANTVNDWLFGTGLLVLVGSGVAGGIRMVSGAAERRAARKGYVFGSGRLQWAVVPRVDLTKDSTADAETLTDLSYSAWAELARRTAYPSSGSIRRREADVRSVPWWRVRTLWQLSHLGGVLLGASGLLAAFLLWWFGGRTDGGMIMLMVVGGVTMVTSGWYAKSGGLATVRRLVGAARAPVPVLKSYVLARDPNAEMPVLVLFPAQPEPDALPDAVLAVLPPSPPKQLWQGLPDPVGTADLRGWLDDEPTVVPWIEDQALWPLQALRKIHPETPEDRSYLCRLMGEESGSGNPPPVL